MSRNKLYLLLSAACTVGFIWLAIAYHRSVASENEIGVCLFKRLTNIPCPSCGSTRSVLLLLKGDVLGALSLNPFGVILMVILFCSPIWIIYDLIGRKATLFNSYITMERLLRQKWVALSVIILVVMNWVWNIYKGL